MSGFNAPEIAWGPLTPVLIVLVTAVVGVLVEAFVPAARRRAVQLVLTLVSLAGALLAIGALWGVAAPASQSLITRQVDPAMQGRVQGALMSLTALAGVVGPAVYAGSFGWAVSPASPIDLPGIPYLVASSMLLLAIAVAWRHARLPAAPASAGDMPAGP